ncbi:probable E3 ubiquitin-protein ligase HIP1 isoform X1 [Typha angustifolia]|uniref:probable E3 ubiquitin-protein ligase HIP1 isoform X1 n=1 Tax=Typha angustifolia TaxID=59011 RepID=UPI003C2F2412
MLPQKGFIESSPEEIEFEHGFSSSTSGMDQHFNIFLNSFESQNPPHYLKSSNDVNMSYTSFANQNNSHSGIWSSDIASSSGQSSNHEGHDETKMKHLRASALVGCCPRIEERRSVAAGMLNLESMSINLNSSQVEEGPTLSLSSNLIDIPKNPENNSGGSSINTDVSDSHPYRPVLSDSVHGPSSIGSLNPCGNFSTGFGFMPENIDRRLDNSMSSRRLACKRKNIEGLEGHSSESESANFFRQNDDSSYNSSYSTSYFPSTSSNGHDPFGYLSSANSTGEQLPSFMRRMSSDSHVPVGESGNAGSSQRNFHARMNSAQQNETFSPNMWSLESTIRHFNFWSPSRSSLHPTSSLNQPLEPRPLASASISQNQPHIPVVPGFPVQHFHQSGASTFRIGNSSRSVSIEERIINTREDASARNMAVNSLSDLVSPPDNRQIVQGPRSWIMANQGISVAGNVSFAPRPGTSSSINQPLGPTWVPHRNPSTGYHRHLPDDVHEPFLLSSGSEIGDRGIYIPVQHSGHSVGFQEIGRQSGAVLRGYQPQHLRSALSSDRQSNGAFGIPLTIRNIAADREGRSRMISEIRNALESIRQGGNLQFEDGFAVDQSTFHGGADLHDRHRDMRLDVDDMSYEELLALEERIGYVSTGLGEEMVMKCLKQRKFSSTMIEAPMEDEPCCICREEYVDGEELGTLDCGHDFHTACIKQWLTHKNLCPICKNTALVT